MSVDLTFRVLFHSKSRPADRAVLMALAAHDGDGGSWPSVATIATRLRVDVRTVQRSLRRLEGIGELKISYQGGGRGDMAPQDRPNLYLVQVDCPPMCDRTLNHRVVHRGDSTGELGVTGVSPKPVSRTSHYPPTPRASPARPRRPDPEGTDGHPTHKHHTNAAAKCARLTADRRLPLTPAELLAWCYRLGHGNPWMGSVAVDQASSHQLDTARDGRAVLLGRFRDADR